MKKRPEKAVRIVLYFVIAAAVVLLLLFLLSLALGWYVMAGGKRQTLDEAMQWQSEHYDTSFYDGLKKTEYTVKSFDGYQLHCCLLEDPSPGDKYIIISHGYTDNRMGALKYVPMYLDLGFNCIVYDLRGHGKNDKTFTSYSTREGRDIAELVKDTRSRYQEISQLGLHGESLGAASTAASMKYQPDVDFAVCDCGFSDIENVLRRGYKSAHLPGFTFELTDLGGQILYHCSVKDMRPIDSLDSNTVPVLFIHGEDDDFIVPDNSRDMSARTKGMTEVHIIKNAGHAESVLVAPEEYAGIVADFLKKI